MNLFKKKAINETVDDSDDKTKEINEEKETSDKSVSLLTKLLTSSMNPYITTMCKKTLNLYVGNDSENIYWSFDLNNTKYDDIYVSFTIDDAPGYNLDGTIELLNFLKKLNIQVTFFIISSMIKDQETMKINENASKVIQRMLIDGHELANHAVIDDKLLNLTEDEYYKIIKECEDTILLFDKNYNDNDRIKWYRPPSGIMSKTQYKVLTKLNYKIAMSNKFGFDNDNVTNSNYLFKFYTNNIKNGDLMVMHIPDKHINRYELLYSMKTILTELKNRGIKFGTLSQLYNYQNSTVST